MNFISDGFWACSGALIGAAIGGFTTYTIAKKTIKLELQKINISFLIEKLRKLESIKNNYDINYPQAIGSENTKRIIDDYDFLSKTFNDLSHYFFTSIYYAEVLKEYENILLEAENEIIDANSELKTSYFYKGFNLKMDALIKGELKQTISEIKQLTI